MIRTMLVVDVPKRTLFQDAVDIGYLKKGDRILAIRDRTHSCHKPVGLPDVLEGHLATEEIGRGFACVLREEFAHEPYILFWLLSGRHKTWVVADATITSKLANKAQELAFAATDLQHRLAANIVTAD